MTGDAAVLESYKKYAAGDDSALGEIIRAYADGMTFFTTTLVKNPDDAEAIVSDAFVEIALKKKAFRGESALKTYLYAICRHKAIDLIRNREMNMSEIAMSCGFDTIRNFNRVFRQITGYSPRDLPDGYILNLRSNSGNTTDFDPTIMTSELIYE